jgi:hypothetical protein
MRFLFALAFLASTAFAQTPNEPGSELTVSLVTMGQGDDVWELFGHNALWIRDAAHGTDAVYNWGVFNSHQPNFILHFLQGRMLYMMAGYGLDETLAQYRYLNRSVVAQELNLTPAQRLAVRDMIEVNARPENVHYRYDYFRDNCSTRVRDVLDHALNGQLRAAAQSKMTGTTYRSHALRLMQKGKPITSGVDLALGRPTDHELSAWDAMFLPEQVRLFVRDLQVSDGKGGTVPLVKNERVLFQAQRGPEPTTQPHVGLWLAPIGLIVAAILALTGARAENGRRQTRLTAAVVIGLWALIAGLLGTILLILWVATDHAAAYNNENLLLFNPLWLVLAVTIPIYYARGFGFRLIRAVALTILGLAVVALLMHLVRLSAQDNFAIIAAGLPPALAVAWVATRRAAHIRV